MNHVSKGEGHWRKQADGLLLQLDRQRGHHGEYVALGSARAAILLLIILTNDVYVLWDGFFLATSKKYVYILLIGYLVGDLMFNPNVRWKLPTKGFLTYLGKASYGMYMFNPVIIAVFVKMFWKYSYFNGWVFLIGIHVAVLAVVILSFELYEKPLLRLKDRFAVVRTRKY